jgi:hypothetical protein
MECMHFYESMDEGVYLKSYIQRSHERGAMRARPDGRQVKIWQYG